MTSKSVRQKLIIWHSSENRTRRAIAISYVMRRIYAIQNTILYSVFKDIAGSPDSGQPRCCVLVDARLRGQRVQFCLGSVRIYVYKTHIITNQTALWRKFFYHPTHSRIHLYLSSIPRHAIPMICYAMSQRWFRTMFLMSCICGVVRVFSSHSKSTKLFFFFFVFFTFDFWAKNGNQKSGNRLLFTYRHHVMVCILTI